MRKLLLAALLLAIPMALAANGDDQCRNMNGHGDYAFASESCEFDGTTYWVCFGYKTRGTINGYFVEHFQEDWYFADLGSLPAPYPSFYVREFSVLYAKQGMIWGEAQYIFDWRNFYTGGVAVPIMITGGTGMYEGAYGWITFTVTDASLEKLSYDGRVCGPNIADD